MFDRNNGKWKVKIVCLRKERNTKEEITLETWAELQTGKNCYIVFIKFRRTYRMWKMIGGGRISYIIFVIAMMWSTFIFILYSNSSASCLAEMERLRMAVERKGRFVELLRDQNDDLKKKVSRLQQEKRKDAVERSVQEKMYLVREVRLFQPNMNNDTTLKDR